MKALRTSRIEAVPKKVEIHDEFADECGVKHDAHLKLQFNELLDHIENGWEVPDVFYRLDVDKNKDLLLELTGVKHLHLGGRGSDTLVYLIETEKVVFILRIAGHPYLEDYPRGGLLFRRLGLPYPLKR